VDSKKEIDIKKQLGAFYTPQAIVDFMVSRVFDFLEKKKKINLKSKKQFTDSFFSLKILDPAVGTGRFIEGIIRHINYNLKKLGFETKDKEELITEFVSNNLFGIEIDLLALKKCKSNLTIKYPFLKESHLKQLKAGNSLVEPDIYKMFEDENSSLLSPFSWKEEFHNTKFDLIIGNPPYFSFRKLGLEKIENQLLYDYLKKSNYWKCYFRSSADIYFYFIVKSLNHLERKGVLSFIIPSYWITNHFADKLREKILNYKILEIIDFQNQQVFYDGGKRINISSTILSVINEVPSNSLFSVYKLKKIRSLNLNDFFKKENFDEFKVSQSSLTREKWVLSPNQLKLSKIVENSIDGKKLSEIATIAQGVSPGVKNIFVMTVNEAKKMKLEKEILYPFITNKYISKWTFASSNLVTIFPKKITNLEEYPFTKVYLEKNREILINGSDRKKLIAKNKIRWFDFSVYRNIDLFLKEREKILTPYRSKRVSFAYDNKGLLGSTDIYAIFPKRKELLFYLLGILNSKVSEFWFKEAGKKKGIAIEFFSKDLAKFPIPPMKNEKKITEIVKRIIHCNIKNEYSDVEELEKKLNYLVLDEYNLEESFLPDFSFS